MIVSGTVNSIIRSSIEATEFVGESKMEWPLNSGLALYDETTGKWGPSVTDNSANWNNAALDAFRCGDSGPMLRQAVLGGWAEPLERTPPPHSRAAGISTPGYLMKWGDVPFEADRCYSPWNLAT